MVQATAISDGWWRFLPLLISLSVAGCGRQPPTMQSTNAESAQHSSNVTELDTSSFELSSELPMRTEPEQLSEGISSDDTAIGLSGDPVSDELEADVRYRQLVLGTWEDDYQGHRTMTLRADGTGSMLVELTGLKAKLFASRLEFNMQWSLEDGRLRKRTIDGKPERMVSMILTTMGDRVDEQILELSADRLLLLDQDGSTRYDWRRSSDNSENVPGDPTGDRGL